MKEKNNIKMVKYPNNDLYQSRKICAFQKVLKTTTSTQPYPPTPPGLIFLSIEFTQCLKFCADILFDHVLNSKSQRLENLSILQNSAIT